MAIKNKLLYLEFINRENRAFHAPYEDEFEFYDAIKSGDIKKVRLLCSETLSEKNGLGTLSYNTLQNMKYHFTITAALIARSCIEGGMDLYTAYTLSDYYILSADLCTCLKEISKLHTDMCIDYTSKMKNLSKHSLYSRHITKCIDYIYNNLHTRITIKDLASYVNLSPSYLSKLFVQEVSVPISTYIKHKKIETAMNMLVYSDYSVSEISEILAFHSPSYFTEIFHKSTHCTPLEYREKNFRKINKT